MCKVDGGTFGLGEERRPTTVRGFYIDQFEVSVGQAVLFLNTRGSNACDERENTERVAQRSCIPGVGIEGAVIIERDGIFEPVPGSEDTTFLGFSIEGAMEYCAWVGKRVPSSAQWEYAARHDSRGARDLWFPWGDTWQPRASCWTYEGCGSPPRPTVGYTHRGLFDGTGGRADGSSPWGVHDLVGGISELMFACDDADATCITGQPCSCEPLKSRGDGRTEADLRVTTRLEAGLQGVRCVLPI